METNLSAIYTFRLNGREEDLYQTNNHKILKNILEEFDNVSFVANIKFKLPTILNKTYTIESIESRILFRNDSFITSDNTSLETREQILLHCVELKKQY